MFEEAILTERFEELLSHSQQAERMYASLADATADPSMRAQVEQFQRDKQRHIALAQRLLEIVQ